MSERGWWFLFFFFFSLSPWRLWLNAGVTAGGEVMHCGSQEGVKEGGGRAEGEEEEEEVELGKSERIGAWGQK